MESSPPRPAPARATTWIACACLAATLAWFGPLFVVEPLWIDATLYDICAQGVLSGEAMYRDIVDMNFPGIVWIHALLRSIGGWRSETLRGFDLALIGGIALVVSGVARRGAQGGVALQLFTISAMLLYYFACAPICHCQRDVWMLLLVAASARLCVRQLSSGDTSPKSFACSLAEGLLAGGAIWIKPYAVVPLLAVWMVSVWFAVRQTQATKARVAIDTAGLFVGGACAGAAGLAWLAWSGSWASFWDIMLHWSGEYRAQGSSLGDRGLRWLLWSFHSAPWSLLHYLAIPLAITNLIVGLRRPLSADQWPAAAARVVLSTLYLAWLVQAVLLQHPHEYVLATTMLPALGVVAMWPPVAQPRAPILAALAVALVLVLVAHPLTKPNARGVYLPLFREGSSPAVKDAFGMPRLRFGLADWQDLAAVEKFLRQRGVRDKELMCWDDSSPPLHIALHVNPASRFPHAAVWLRFFQSRQAEWLKEFEATPARFVVTDLELLRIADYDARTASDRDTPALPPGVAIDEFPWREPVVFRAGRYLVHEVRR